MKTFEEMYKILSESAISGNIGQEVKKLKDEKDCHAHLDCLLNPQNYAPVIKLEKCECGSKLDSKCIKGCKFGALISGNDGDGDIIIDKEKCTGCGVCISSCNKGNFRPNKELIPVINTIRSNNSHVYALIAPAFIGQLSNSVSPGQIRAAFKKAGFAGMIEVALFADILTLKEALEFDRRIKTSKDFQLTSCCCPIWISMIRKIYKQLTPHIPASVSPMIACGRAVKLLHPNSTTVFIGPCLAKRAEARENDIKDAIDYVLTFNEIKDLFDMLSIDLNDMENLEKNHSSKSGRIYARAGGVSEAVSDTLKRIQRHGNISIKSRKADGIKECKEMINDLVSGKTSENFFEGMGCKGGCVGGPRAILNKEEGTINVNKYGDQAQYPTPIDNPYVIELLGRLGFDTAESLLKDNKIFTRNF